MPEQASIAEQPTVTESLDEPIDDEQQLDPNATITTPPISNGQRPGSVAPDVPIELSPSIIAIKKRGPPYICDCGYNCKRLIARVINHQREGACPNNPRTAPLIPCEVCSKSFTFSGLKSHLKPFAEKSSRSTYSREHSQVTVQRHKEILEEVKLKYAPKRLKLSDK